MTLAFGGSTVLFACLAITLYMNGGGATPGTSSATAGTAATSTYFADRNAEQSYSKCTALVKSTLDNNELSTDVSERIGQILGAQYVYPESKTFNDDCCKDGTEFDHFLLLGVPSMEKLDFMESVDEKTALMIIDVQNDFTVGSFGQPCWGFGGDQFSKSIASLATEMAGRGATIIASKDFHPDNHCSFGGTCLNTKDEEVVPGRYKNYFPSHCTYTDVAGNAVPQTGSSTPFCQAAGHGDLPWCSNSEFTGSNFDTAINDALSAIAETKPEQVEVMFKGFHKDYDSFSAIPHLYSSSTESATSDDERKFTGGYALPLARKQECLVGKNFDDQKCYPTVDELAGVSLDVVQPSSTMRSMQSIMKDRGINKLLVVGLVYDFCVKETAIFAEEWDALDEGVSLTTVVLADYTRPSFDGKPGAPYSQDICDNGASVGDFCMMGGGTTMAHANTLDDYMRNGVDVRRFNFNLEFAPELVA